ncbi:hypothetical protein TL16_g11363 [Triparma laevis f. inornata]|uniref:TLC domain-containing protein n=1 Tax=Triparma laevis f. inornata TaxID=1714386 RepID=A0A9W7BK61_9STRA|nr:hypothetical protein TL16_g11363 [Triparma laevis f. inornata]
MYSFLISSSPVLYLNSLVFGLPGPKSSPPPAYLQILFFGSLLTLTRFLWDHLVLVPNGWQTATDDKERECLGGLVALTHSTLLLGPLFGLLMTHPTMKPSSQFSDSPPKWNYAAKTLISYTTSYMLQDAFWMLYYSTDPSQSAYPSPGENDMMFLLHHLATILYMSSCRYIDAGHYSAMWLMWLGEVTNPVHNVYLLLEYARVNHPGENVEVLFFYFSKGEGDDVRVAQFTSFIDEFIISNIVASLFSSPLLSSSLAFALSYGLLRIFIGPLAGLWIVYDLILTPAGRKNVGLVLGIIWAILIEEVLKGSFYYAFDVAIKAW